MALLRRNPAFRRLYVAQLISFAGDWFATVALLGLVLELTDSAAAASLVIVLQTGGFALASPFAGILAIVGIKRPFQQQRELVPDSGERRPPGAGVIEALAIVLRFARQSRQLSALLVSKTIFGAGTGVILMLAVFGRDVFGSGDVGIGILYGARGIGVLLGPFIARALVGTDDRSIVRGILGSLITVSIGYALFPLAPTIWVAAVFVFVAHLGGGAQWMLSTLGLQRAAPDAIRGRIFSFDYGLVTLTISISTIVSGILAETFAPAIAVWVMVGLIVIFGAVWAWFTSPLRGQGVYSAPAE